jgi:hypothetical protein
MTIRKRTGSLLVTAATAAAVIGLCAAPALASPSASPKFTVKVSGGGKFTANSSKTVLSNNGVSVTCTNKGKKAASTAAGSIANVPKPKPKPAPVQVGTSTKLSFNNCNGPLGPVSTKIMALPYKISVDSKTNGKGQTDGIIAGVKVKVSMTACSFTVTGSAPGYYTNKTHTLTVTPKLPVKAATKAQLTIANVVGCAGVVKNGQHPSFVGTYPLGKKGPTISSK